MAVRQLLPVSGGGDAQGLARPLPLPPLRVCGTVYLALPPTPPPTSPPRVCGEVYLTLPLPHPPQVFFAFGDAPDPFTVYGGALLLLTLLVHEVAGMRAAALAPDGPAGSDSVDSTSGSLFERSPHARPHVSPPISRGGTLYLSPRAEPASALLLPASLGQPLLPDGALSGGGVPLRRPEGGGG